MESFFISVGGSLLASAIIAIVGKWQGWWWKSKSESSVELATRVFKALDGEVIDKTSKMIYATKQLGDSLVISYKNNTAHNTERENEALQLIEEILSIINPLASELSAAPKELDYLKRAVLAFKKGIEWRSQIVKHLCKPPNKGAMDPGHVREQLLVVNTDPDGLMQAAKGEAALFLRGYGVGWGERKKYKKDIIKKHKAIYERSIESDYRKVLQQTALHNARK